MVTFRTALAGIAMPLALSWATAAVAESDYPGGWYFGASVDETHVEVFRSIDWEEGVDEAGFSLRGGLRIKKRFAVEFAAQRAGDLTWTEHFTSVPGYPGFYDASTTFDLAAVQVSAVGVFPFGEIFEGVLRGGFAQYSLSGSQTLDDAFSAATLSLTLRDSGYGYLIGLGLAVHATPKWRIRLEGQFFEIDRSFLAVTYAEEVSVDSVTIGIDYQLGQRSR